MDRRRFLELSGAATAAAVLTGCGGGGSSSSSGTPITPPVVPVGPDWQGLATTIQGNIIQPGNASYNQARLVYNPRYDAILPQAIVRCASADDVNTALAFIRKNGLTVTARSGGHSYAGYSTGTGVVIDVGAMNTITVGNGTATIGAGAKLADVYDQLTAQGVAIPSGTCSTVGIAGITMGGGIGIVDRAYGLTCDNLISAQVVTADGKIVTCDASNEPDLFWALRGGGGGNFGIVTSFTFKTHTTSDITVGIASFSMDDTVKVMAAWQTWGQTLPDTIWSNVIFSWSSGNTPYLLLKAICVGSVADLTPYWDALLLATQSTAERPGIFTIAYRDIVLGDCGGLTVAECHIEGKTPAGKKQRTEFASTSDFFDAVVPNEGIQALRQAFLTNFASYASGVADGTGAAWIFDLMGGAIGRVASDATAFPHRGALFSAEYYNLHTVAVADAKIDSEQVAANNVRAIMKPWSSGRAYVNYIDPLITDWKTAYYGGNYARLVQVKAKYDPTGLFKFPQGIPTS